MTREPTDEELLQASSVVLMDLDRPVWGITIPIPLPSDPDILRMPIFAPVNSTDDGVIERRRQRIAELSRRVSFFRC